MDIKISRFRNSSCNAGKLDFYEADLLTDSAFDEAVKGTHFVFHTASPFFIQVKRTIRPRLATPACPLCTALHPEQYRAGMEEVQLSRGS